MLGLYFYRARRPTLGDDADLRDASCRPDPDFDWLTLGLCRPGLRKRIARLAVAAPIDLLFYARVPATDALLLVALVRVLSVHANHFDASAGFKDGHPRNLMVPGNPCLLGTIADPTSGQVAMRRPTELCGCPRYVMRADTPYLHFVAHEPGAVRCDDPVRVRWEELRRISPAIIGQRWSGTDLAAFQKATQNGAHWIGDAADAEALREFFLGFPRAPRSTTNLKGDGSAASVADCGSGRRGA